MRLYTQCLLLFSIFCRYNADEEGTCSWRSDDAAWRDPALQEMTYDVGDGPQTFWAYVQPNVTSFYRLPPGQHPPASTPVVPKFNGIAGKFINLSNQSLTLYWESKKNGPVSPMRHYEPFSSGGTATFPKHRFFYTPDGGDPKTDRVIEFVMGEFTENLYVYDPYRVEGNEKATEANLQAAFTEHQRELYDLWQKTFKFNEFYHNVTGRTYLTSYLRKPPTHFMWPADYFGQEHWVTTKETHFENLPPVDKLKPIAEKEEARILKEDDPRNLAEYRVKDQPVMNMTLKVLSCAPRVFEIRDFLSPAEVQHILDLARGVELSESRTGDGAHSSFNGKDDTSRSKTRTSFNSWLPRDQSPVVDAIYRRSADLVRIDEALLRRRSPSEYPEVPSRKSIAESLQLVHYGPTQEYTAHHDFGYTRVNDKNHGARYLTLLFYLNDSEDGLVGGETSFPRWVNAETFYPLTVTPEAGKAILFYSQLPDGNMDDLSQHAAEPVKEGEKWLINLWIWDPVYEK